MAPAHFVPDPPSFRRCVPRLEREAPEPIGGVLKEECRQQYQVLKQRALGSLISSGWLVEEARARGLTVPRGSLATKAAVAEAKLRRMVTAAEPKITQREVAAYYRKNIKRYERPEQREIELAEHIPTKREAQTLLLEARRRGTISDMAVHAPVLLVPETIPNSSPAELPLPRRAALKAIFAAKPHAIVGPVPLNEQWCFFEVTRVSSRAVKPLAEVSSSIERQLAQERRRRTLASFVVGWRRRWLARTDCSPGYVIQKCRQYRGPKTPEDSHSFS